MKVRVFVILFIVFFIINDSLAQGRLYVTPVGMSMRTYVYNKADYHYPYLKYHPTYGRGAGVSFDYKLKGRWRFIYGLVFQENYQKWSFDNNRVKGNIRLGYLKNIFLLRYNILEKRKINLYVAAGSSISLLASVSGAIPVYAPGQLHQQLTVPAYVNNINPGGMYKRIQSEIMLSFGIEFLPQKTLSPFCQFLGYASIFDIENKNAIYYGGGMDGDIMYQNPNGGGPVTKVFQYDNYPRRATRNYAYGIIFGLRIRLRE
jgi:hypothetical protein